MCWGRFISKHLLSLRVDMRWWKDCDTRGASFSEDGPSIILPYARMAASLDG